MMIIVVFDAMIMGYLSMVYISSFFFITNKAMLMGYDDSSFVLHLSAMSITQAMIMGCKILFFCQLFRGD